MPEWRLQKKTGIVTGGASGIGAATAALFHAEGAVVIATDIHEPDVRSGPEFMRHDISSEDDWNRVASSVVGRFGRLDILVNCAGINGATFGVPQDPEHITIEQYRRVMAVNAEGTLLGCRAAIGAMKEHGGAIVNVGSLSSLLALPGMVDYGASKAVIAYLTRAAAADCIRKGYRIRVNAVTPGAVLTPLWDVFLGGPDERAESMDKVRESIPMKEWGMPEDVAYAALFLASDEAKHVTGADILVDGGQYLMGTATRGR
mgnify:CR=1 FL=1